MEGLRFGAALGAVLAVFAAGQTATAETLTLTTINATSHWGEDQGNIPFMECVKTATSGELDFNYFTGGQIANSANSLDVLGKGLAQMSYINMSSVAERLPLLQIALLPGMGEDTPQMMKAIRASVDGDGPIGQEIRAAGIKPLMINIFPPYQIMSRTDALKTAADFTGRKVRVAGSVQTFGMTELGAAPVQIAFGDIYLAMQQGTVDAYMFSSITMKDYSLQEVTSAVSRNGHFGSAGGLISIEQKAFDALSPEMQAALVDCGRKQEEHLAAYAGEQVKRLEEEFTGLGLEIYDFTPEEKAALDAKLALAADEYVARLAGQGLPAEEALAAYRTALGN